MMQAIASPSAASIVGLLLAAGAGSRFDPSGKSSKLLAACHHEDAVVAMAARAMLDALPRVLAVVRDTDETTAALLAGLGCEVSVCAHAAQGISATLRHGLSQSQTAQGWIIALGDMPYVQPATVRALAQALAAGADIAAPRFRGRRGNPVGFSRKHLPALMQLSGDEGARRLLRNHPVVEIEVNDEGILRDIDLPSDLAAPATHRKD